LALLVYFYYRPGGRDAASLEWTKKILQQLELPYSCCHEGGHDHAVPSWSQGSDGIHLHQPCGKVGRKETLDEKKMMRRRRNLFRVFTLTKGCFIYKHEESYRPP
jgi:hypothetical protein